LTRAIRPCAPLPLALSPAHTGQSCLSATDEPSLFDRIS
jgi:hypothetical protein